MINEFIELTIQYAVDYQQSPKNINDFLLKCELSEAWIEQNLK